MYRYDDFDRQFIRQRSAQFRKQVERRLNGGLSEDEFKPLRLQNGLYLQLHAYMLRVAIPYGILSADQLRQLAMIAERYDRAYGHFTTRQNIQFNWVALQQLPQLLDDLAAADLHCIQTSGNCIRNITADPFAGVAADEYADPRPYCEALRQWSSAHPEFAYLPRKFKFAVIGAQQDRAAIKLHDIGLRLHPGDDGRPGFEIWVGGGQGRTPKIAHKLFSRVPVERLLATLESMLRVYNLEGRRDNKYKARIKILVNAIGPQQYRDKVLADLQQTGAGAPVITRQQIAAIGARFTLPPAQSTAASQPESAGVTELHPADPAWLATNVYPHRQPDHRIVVVSLKPPGGIPGDATSEQMRRIADLADEFSYGEVRVTKNQNLVLPQVPQTGLAGLYPPLRQMGLHTANIGRASDITACPGLDYCSLATARSIPLAQQLSRRLSGSRREHALGNLKINISGCINACGHHHVADIGILGLEKKNREFYQISLGGRDDQQAAIGKILGPGFSAEELPGVIDQILDLYLHNRIRQESFSDTLERLGHDYFKERIYAHHAA